MSPEGGPVNWQLVQACRVDGRRCLYEWQPAAMNRSLRGRLASAAVLQCSLLLPPRSTAASEFKHAFKSSILCDGLQAPELYAMAMAAAGALGVTEAPELWLQPSAQAAVHYLRMPLRRFHGLDGDLGFTVSAPHVSKKQPPLVLPCMPCETTCIDTS